MRHDFTQITHSAKVFLSHSEIFDYITPTEDIILNIKHTDVDKSLIILSRLSMLDDNGLDTVKRELLKMSSSPISSKEVENTVAFSTDNLNYTMKWFLAYGSINVGEPTEISGDNVSKVIHIVLQVSDYISLEDKTQQELRKTAQRLFLSLKIKSFGISLYRQEIMFEILAKNPKLFRKKDFVEIHKKFEEVNDYSIKDYLLTVSTLGLNSEFKLTLDQLTAIGLEKNPETYFKKLSNKEKTFKVCKDILIAPSELRDWALETIDNEYDYEEILPTPFFTINNKVVVSSPTFVGNALFDGLFFKIKNCVNAKKFFTFYGKIFEQYVSKTLLSAGDNSSLPYEIIPEFNYGHENLASSDVYVKLGKSLLIIECKGGRLSRDTKIHAEDDASEKDFNKYVTIPLNQAYNAYLNIIKEDSIKFGVVNKIYIISVSSHSFPKAAKENLTITKEDVAPNDNRIKGVDYIGLSELERIAYAIENYDESIFKLIKNKLSRWHYIQYDRFFHDKGYELNRTKWHSEVLFNTMDELIKTAGFESTLKLEDFSSK